MVSRTYFQFINHFYFHFRWVPTARWLATHPGPSGSTVDLASAVPVYGYREGPAGPGAPHTDVVPPSTAATHSFPRTTGGAVLHTQALPVDAASTMEGGALLSPPTLWEAAADFRWHVPPSAESSRCVQLLPPSCREPPLYQVPAEVHLLEPGHPEPVGRGAQIPVPCLAHVQVQCSS